MQAFKKNDIMIPTPYANHYLIFLYILCFCCFLCYTHSIGQNVNVNKDLYNVLGIDKKASALEIKKAYRQKARDTHPDKNPDVDSEVAAERFRNVADAYETLSDESTRRQYDQQRQQYLHQQQNIKRRQQFRQNNGHRWAQHHNRHQHFNQRRHSANTNTENHYRFNRNTHTKASDYLHKKRSRTQNHNNKNFGKSKESRFKDRSPQVLTVHSFYGHPHHASFIQSGQENLLSVTSLEHLHSVVTQRIETDVPPNNDKSKEESIIIPDRNIVLAFYDSSIRHCEDFLNKQLLFPYPFVGYSMPHEDENFESNMRWDSIVLPLKIDLASDTKETDIIRQQFDLSSTEKKPVLSQCVTIVMINKGQPLSEYQKIVPRTHEEFDTFVRSKMRLKITFVNKTPFGVQVWWMNGVGADGKQGKQQGVLKPMEATVRRTFLTHSFFFRSTTSDGPFTNESALLWYTAVSLADDNLVLDIVPKCVDTSGHCPEWKKEGYCDRNSLKSKLKWNRDVVNSMKFKCQVTCEIGCGELGSTKRREKRGKHFQKKVHTEL